ncbi:hypothetical protein HYFRA_00011579 [Hymenoscyphus fraxineus]|uniref:Uncharacterized protein n=1 Tax=Hymenoscyphus fraxineus TaxID=746836 RepID=A0A9N9L2K2_9HELO|nr:hypothetical protein HYFRA_00011579 [Hymenoscyphus fraxineus]
MATLTWWQEDNHPFSLPRHAPLTLQLKVTVLNLFFSRDFLSDFPRSWVFGYFKPIKLELNQHIYREEEIPPQVSSRLHNGARFLHVGVDTSSGIVTQRTAGSTKSTYQIRITASIRDEKGVVGVDAKEGPISWTLCVQFDLAEDSEEKDDILGWGWGQTIRLLRDAVKGGFAEDGSPAGGPERMVPHFLVGAFWITTDRTG